MKIIVTIILLCCLSITSAKEKLIAATLQLYPWSYIEEGVMKGAFYEPMELIKENYTGKIQHLTIPLSRALQGMVTTNAYDLALFTPGPHSKQLYDLGVVLDGVMLIALPRKGIIINSIDDFKGLKIGTPRGISADTPVIDSSIYKVEFSNDNIFGLRMLDQKRTDVYVETNVSISAVAEKLKFDPEKYEKPFILIKGEIFHVHLWLNLKSKITEIQRAEIENIIKDLKSKNLFNTFVDKRLNWLEKIK